MKLAVVVQRYGADINGGAELHARYVAERLVRHATVEVLTTCARDYVTWRNELPAGTESLNGVTVRRFPVARPRDTHEFGRRSLHVFDHPHSLDDEIRWLEAEGPTSPSLIRHVKSTAGTTDFFIFFSYRYYHAWHGIRAVPGQAILVPTAERDAAAGLAMFGATFRAARALMYNSAEEKALIEHVSGRTGPGVVVGVGSEVPTRTEPQRARKQFGLRRPFAVYIGRIDENKGCGELFRHFERYAVMHPHGLDLVLVGSTQIDVPKHPRIRHLGFLSERDKYDVLAASDVLIMPSLYESLSMVTLEAWALGKPVLVNGRCDVLRGQAVRSNAGLYYETFEEFAEALYALEGTGPLGANLGRNGQDYFRRHYAWPVIERRYVEMLGRLRGDGPAAPTAAPLEPLPGWWARRRRTLPPARRVVEAAPSGPVVRG